MVLFQALIHGRMRQLHELFMIDRCRDCYAVGIGGTQTSHAYELTVLDTNTAAAQEVTQVLFLPCAFLGLYQHAMCVSESLDTDRLHHTGGSCRS